MMTRMSAAAALIVLLTLPLLGCEPPANNDRFDETTNGTEPPREREEVPRQTPRDPMPNDY